MSAPLIRDRCDPGVTEWDFFVSYQRTDRTWAEWTAWQRWTAGHSILLQLWDFVPGTNWVKLMRDGASRSARVIVVLSPAYTGGWRPCVTGRLARPRRIAIYWR